MHNVLGVVWVIWGAAIKPRMCEVSLRHNIYFLVKSQ
jgi:hypothetical protein